MYYAIKNKNNLKCRCCQQVFEFLTDKHKIVVLSEKAMLKLNLKENEYSNQFQGTPVRYSIIFNPKKMAPLKALLI